MEYRKLGRSGLKVSPLCLGTMMFGARTTKTVAARIFSSAFDAGINFIDTADSYAKGESERIVGQLLGKQRERWVLASKVARKTGEDYPNAGGLSRKWIMHEIDTSLGRLKTDYIDIYYLHHDERSTPLSETLGAMGDLIRAGKVRYLGLSNFQGWRIAEVMSTCRQLAVPQPIVLQPCYNAMQREAEVEMFPACEYYGVGAATYSPLARGVLTGKYLPGAKPSTDTRALHKDKNADRGEYRIESLNLAQRIKTHAESRGMTAGQFALNWVINNKLVTSAIAGPRTFEQWREYLGALDHSLDARDEAFIDRLVAPGHSTPGFINPKFPVQGRIACNSTVGSL